MTPKTGHRCGHVRSNFYCVTRDKHTVGIILCSPPNEGPVPTRASRQTEEALRKINFVVLPHPSYSPDIAPSDFYLFPKLKEHLKGNHYESDEDVEAAIQHWFSQKCVNFFTDGMRQLVRRWQLCVDRDGNYVEK
ncbi:histone-lysine N-methyltransferase SETMAR [Elysia marginata]|uniref:Histone-lysine N-methyltransferase SETMAR n=1 Tax=Elysia marginata TaxID=1093978 RepID=A0AAV4I439_9GAST|nr:histone-lysine N-methyltransferase SETMAR [Elysia marginata]